MVVNSEVLLSELFLIPKLIYTLVLIGRTMMISLITSVGECKCASNSKGFLLAMPDCLAKSSLFWCWLSDILVCH